MTILYEVGLEVEYWLVDSDNIIEAPAYNFPADEMGFLIEIRSSWGSDPESIVSSIMGQLEAAKSKAKSLGFSIECKAYKEIDEDWQRYIANKYKHDEMEDLTRNIYNATYSHHTGLLAGRATAGCHVHFSRWDTEEEDYSRFTEAEIESIVEKMDRRLATYIGATARISGEWEPKPYHGGFEYRSLPGNVPLLDVAKIALEILSDT